MAITSKQNEDLQKQYDLLRSQGQTKEDATAGIKSQLQKTVMENPVAGTADTAYNQLKDSYKQGGVEGGWIADSVVKPTTGTGGLQQNTGAGVSTPATPTGLTGATTGGVPPATGGTPASTTGLTNKNDTTSNVPPPVTDKTTGTGAVDTYGNNIGQFTPEQQKVYDNMTPAEKMQMKADTDAGLATAANYMLNFKKNKDYLNTQNDINKKIVDETGKIKEIQSSERIKAAETKLNNLKQNVAYLGTGGKPGVSAVKMDAISKQLASANTTFQNLKAVEASQAELTRLGIKFDANAFEKQMTDLQTDLDNNVSKQIQNAINEKNAADVGGKLDTIEEINAFRTKLFAGLDNQISGVAEINLTQRAAILKEYADMENKAMDAIAKSKVIDPVRSKAEKFYVDGNGKPMISAITGLMIPVPQDAPYPPNYDPKTGNMVIFSTDANGQLVATRTDLIKDVPFSQEMTQYFAQAVVSGRMTEDNVPESVRNTEGYLRELAQAPGVAKPQPQVWSKLNDNTLFNQATGEQKSVSSVLKTSSDASTTDIATKASSVQNGIYGGSCGRFVNTQIGQAGLFGDSIEQKKSKINSSTPEVGSVVIMNSNKFPQNGHVGIVTGIQGDQIIVKDSNWNGDNKTTEHNFNANDPNIQGYYVKEQGKISDDIDLRVGRIATTIYGKTASDKESKRVEDIINNNPNVSDNDIMDAVLGFSIKPEFKQVSDKIHDVVLQNTNVDAKAVLPSIGRLINEGKIPEAVRSLENSVLASVNKDNLGNEKIREDKVKTSIQLAKSLDELIRKGESVIGPVDGTIQEWLGKFKSTEAQTIQRKIREITAKMRNELSGTAVTATEALFLAPIIPELSDTKDNALDKIKGLRTNPLTEFNNLRSIGGLPPLNETSLGDPKQRANIYQNVPVEVPKEMQDRLKKSISTGGNVTQIKADLQEKGYDTSFLGAETTKTTTTATGGRWQQSQTNSLVGATAQTQGRWQSNQK